MPVMSVQEAASYASLSVETIRRHIRSGRLAARTFGRTYVIEERDLKKLLANPPKPGRPPRRKST